MGLSRREGGGVLRVRHRCKGKQQVCMGRSLVSQKLDVKRAAAAETRLVPNPQSPLLFPFIAPLLFLRRLVISEEVSDITLKSTTLVGSSSLTSAISGRSSTSLAAPKLSSCSQGQNPTPLLLLQMFHVGLLTGTGCDEGRCCYPVIHTETHKSQLCYLF